MLCRVAYEQRIKNYELTLKCKLKCYVRLMKDPLGASPSKGNQGTIRGKEKTLLTSVEIEPMTSGIGPLPNLEVVGSIPIGVKRVFFFASCGSLIPFTRTGAQ